MEHDAESLIVGQTGNAFKFRRVEYALPWEVVPGRRPGFIQHMFGDLDPLAGLNCVQMFELGVPPSIPETPAPAVPEPRVVVTSNQAASSAPAKEGEAFLNILTKVPRMAWPKLQGMKKQAAIEKWRLIVADSYSGSRVGRQLIEFQDDVAAQAAILADVFEPKAASTLEARASSMLLYARWLKANTANAPIMPVTEPLAYKYVNSLAEDRAPATRATKFVEALAFCHGMLGLAGAKEVLESRRVSGASLKSMRTKRMTVKREPFTVEEVMLLELAVLSLSGPDQIFAGFLCFLIHTRCRFSDAMASSEPRLDLDESGRGFIECDCSHTKTSETKAKRHLLLPLAGLAFGLSDQGWAKTWLEARKSQGLTRMVGCLMPAPGPQGTWTEARLSCSEANVWIKELFKSLGKDLRDKNVGTHSCKATLLSYCAKAHVPIEQRKLLGYHSTQKSTLEYSRDALAEPLSWLQSVVWAIVANDFSPDCTRSGRWKPGKSLAAYANYIGERDGPPTGGVATPPLQEADRADPENEEFVLVEAAVHQRTPHPQIDSQAGASSDDGFGPGLATGSEKEWDSFASEEHRDPEREAKEFVESLEADGLFTPNLQPFSTEIVYGQSSMRDAASLNEGSWDESSSQYSEEGSGPSSAGEAAEDPETDSEVVCSEFQMAAEKAASPFAKSRAPAKNPGLEWYRHKRFGTHHVGRRGSETHLACGRQYLSQNYELLRSRPIFDYPRCEICFGASVAAELD
jgi:hypothetical protein